MAQSVSRINVTVGSNVSQLASGMQQAAKSVGGFSASAGQAQFAVQQLVFAADDAVASYGTGGFSGAIRGAQNNITAFASSLFGVKGLMIAVAGFAAIQLAKSLLNIKDSTKAAKDEAEGYIDTLKRQLDIQDQIAAARNDVVRSGRNQDPASARRRFAELGGDVFAAESALSRSQAERERVANKFVEVGNTEIQKKLEKTRDDALKALDERIAKQKEELQVLRVQLETQRLVTRAVEKAANADLERRRKEKLEGAPDDPRSLGLNGTRVGVLGELSRRARGARERLDPFRFFGTFPSAQRFGSAGALSAINQGQYGRQNVESAQLRELQDIKRSSADISRTLGSRLPLAVEVSL